MSEEPEDKGIGWEGKLAEFASFNMDLDGKKIKVLDLHGSYDRPNDLSDYTILSHIPIEEKCMLIEQAKQVTSFNRSMGALVGMGVGDALGAPLEFLPAQAERGEKGFDFATMSWHGARNKFRLKPGQWTDDSAMGLCMADSMLLHRHLNFCDMRVRFWCWWYRGYNNAFRKDPDRAASVGLGGNISKSLANTARVVLQHQTLLPFYAPPGGSSDSGNGSLMRLAPVPLLLQKARPETLHEAARQSSMTSHPGPMAAEACTFLAHLIWCALRLPEGEANAKTFLEDSCDSYWKEADLDQKSGEVYDYIKMLVRSSPTRDEELCWNWKSERLELDATLRARGSKYNGYPVTAGYFGAFCMDGLAMALWAVYNTSCFDDAVTRCANLLGDADSHASMTGQLAGALYGYNSINPQFLKWLNEWDDHDFAIRALFLQHLSMRIDPEELAVRPETQSEHPTRHDDICDDALSELSDLGECS